MAMARDDGFSQENPLLTFDALSFSHQCNECRSLSKKVAFEKFSHRMFSDLPSYSYP